MTLAVEASPGPEATAVSMNSNERVAHLLQNAEGLWQAVCFLVMDIELLLRFGFARYNGTKSKRYIHARTAGVRLRTLERRSFFYKRTADQCTSATYSYRLPNAPMQRRGAEEYRLAGRLHRTQPPRETTRAGPKPARTCAARVQY